MGQRQTTSRPQFGRRNFLKAIGGGALAAAASATTPSSSAGEASPEPLRHDSGHGGSHTFLTHEFIDALVSGRRPAIDIHEALAYTAPGIVAHQSALQGGTLLKIPDFGHAA